MGGWQQCSSTCGSEGVRKRTVLCVRTVSGEERVLHPVECKHLLKPKPIVPCNRDIPCGQEWAVSNWEEVLFFFCILLFCCSFNLSSAFPASSKLMSHLCPLIFAVPSHVWRRCPLTHSHVCSGTQEDLRPLHQTSVQIAVWPTELPQLRSSQTAGASP